MTRVPLIVPAPAVLEVGRSEGFLFCGATRVVVESPGADASDPGLEDVVRRFAADVEADTGIGLTVSHEAPGPAVQVSIRGTDLDAVPVAAGMRADGASITGAADERYGLDVSDERILVWGATPEAVHRGLTSLRQLVAASAADGRALVGAVRVLDGPRFAWRGLSLDVVRTFHDVETVERVLDMCSLYKINVLHLHLSDDQGWRLEVPSRPALTEVGSAGAVGDRPGGFYSLEEVAGLVAYAADRFVTLVPEIEMPGHAAAIFRSYPELGPRVAAADLPSHGAAVAAGTLDPTRPEVWRFVEDVLDAVLPQFPQSAYVHIGGDEAFGMDHDEHAAFVERAIALVRDRGRRVVGWQEIARADLDADMIVQHWIDIRAADAETLRGRVPDVFLDVLIGNLQSAVDDVPRALERGARVIVSPSARLYFDRPHGDASTDDLQNGVRARLGMPVYPPATIRSGVEWDPVADVEHVTSDDQVAGVEAALWCETVTGRDDLELLLLPRLPGAAEKAWSAAGSTDWDEYRERLACQSVVWTRRGWRWYRADTVDWA
ncbi:family 20 glycosylhydrolase [Microbacterium sp. BWT-B31]|uniref:family 20 glycosylhydrolase n=1 Tax=Microbacterium sp. BWT-B31 TaxID=3232072 RepID=UPI0035299038